MNNNTQLLRFGENFLDTTDGKIIKRSVALPILKKTLGEDGFYAFLALPLDDAGSPYISDIIFDPTEPYGVIRKGKNSYWNTFNGFMEDKQKTGDITPILDHLYYIVCNRTLNGEAAYPYVLKFLAHMVQKPYEKPRVALAFYSKSQQVGKGIFFKVLLGKLLGNMLKTTSNPEDIFGKANTLCCDSLLTVLDEIGSEKKPHKSLVNNVITEKTICMKYKNNPHAQMPTYNRIIHLTNSDSIQDIWKMTAAGL
jgi:putative DNA primase/helicase